MAETNVKIRVGVKDAVAAALKYVAEVLPKNQYSRVTLEEIDIDEKEDFWLITIGLEEPEPDNSNPLAAAARQQQSRKKEYKMVRVDARTGNVRSMTIRSV